MQLQRLNLNMPLVTCQPYLNPQLTYLKFDCSQSIPPQIFSNSLKHLELGSLTPEFRWSIFYNNTTSKITFKSLLFLSIQFGQGSHITNRNAPYRLCFPSLQELELHNCHPNNDILSADFGTAKLKSITLSGGMDNIILYYNLQIKTQFIQVISEDASIANDQASPIFGTNDNNIKEICIRGPLCKFISQDTSWAHLKSLQLYTTVDFDVLINAMIRVPWLERLIVDNIGFMDISKENIDNITNIDSCDFCLKYLHVITGSWVSEKLELYAINSLISRLY
ncbi:hypothetical protein BX667DRAFT_501333, partial [Coemansia mojavensis]